MRTSILIGQADHAKEAHVTGIDDVRLDELTRLNFGGTALETLQQLLLRVYSLHAFSNTVDIPLVEIV